MNLVLALDTSGLLLVNHALGAGPIGTVFVLISHLGDWAIVWLALCFLVLWDGKGDERSHRTVVLTVVALIVGELLAYVLKAAIARPRPAEVVSGVRLLGAAPGNFGLPSAHAVRSFAAAGVLATYFRRQRWALWLLASLIALSRVAVGAHYPLDVLAGAVVGGAVAWGILMAGSLWDRSRRPERRDAAGSETDNGTSGT